MKNKKYRRNKLVKKLIRSILVTVVGMMFMYLNFWTYNARMTGKFAGVPESDFMMVLEGIGICTLECGSGLIGIVLLFIGIHALCHNARRLKALNQKNV